TRLPARGPRPPAGRRESRLSSSLAVESGFRFHQGRRGNAPAFHFLSPWLPFVPIRLVAPVRRARLEGFTVSRCDPHVAFAKVILALSGSVTMTEKISNAVVLHGPGRSGTTLFSRILSTHSAFAWISGYVNRFPGYPFLAVFNRVMEIDTVERFSRSRRFWPRPAEAYNFWNRYFPYFSEPEIRGRTKQHDRPDECIAAIRHVQRYQRKDQFIT